MSRQDAPIRYIMIRARGRRFSTYRQSGLVPRPDSAVAVICPERQLSGDKLW